jgi:hypothetical protein
MNKNKIEIKWPNKETHFTVNDLFDLNPDIKEITVRLRLSKAVEQKSVAKIGTLSGSKGAPKIVYSMTPVNQSTIDNANKNGISMVGERELINVLDITPTSNNETPAVDVKKNDPVVVSQ